MPLKAVILLNMGGPDSLSAVKPFLYNLFSDREIIKLGPYSFQKIFARLISSLRLKKSMHYYQLIGGRSPLNDITHAQASALENILGPDYRVYVGMRYWHPFIEDTVKIIEKSGINHIVVLSLYPQFSLATTGSSIKEYKRVIHGKKFTTRYINQWYNFTPYIESLLELIDKELLSFNRYQDVDVLFSAHSLPEYFIKKGDPYLEQTEATISEINKRLSLQWHLSFQSRSGPVKWLKPSTEEMIRALAGKGCKKLFVVPISFVSDNIETLYELDILYKQMALKRGIDFRRCRALNTSQKFIQSLQKLVLLETQRAGWS
jgi:ferrochelatase